MNEKDPGWINGVPRFLLDDDDARPGYVEKDYGYRKQARAARAFGMSARAFGNGGSTG